MNILLGRLEIGGICTKTQIKIAAVGDILMIGPLLRTVKHPSEDKYNFDSLFSEVAPILKAADLTIGNLETPLAGREAHYTQKNAKTRFTMFNCPDELAPALKKAGFDVLTTGNNHCLDRGVRGLKRTLKKLDEQGIDHTGTYATEQSSKEFLIKDVKGIRIGILSYSKSTNRLPIPKDEPWVINLIGPHMAKDIRKLKQQADLVIVCIHFGQEYRHKPIAKQRRWVDLLFESGADIILGTHPHVVEPMLLTKDNKFVIYSLGNFISTILNHNRNTHKSLILQLEVTKDDSGHIAISKVQPIPTGVLMKKIMGRIRYKIHPISSALTPNSSLHLTAIERETLNQMGQHTQNILARKSWIHPKLSKNEV